MARILPIQAVIETACRTDSEGKQADNTPAASNHLGIITPELKTLLQMYGKNSVGHLNTFKYGSRNVYEKDYQYNIR